MVRREAMDEKPPTKCAPHATTNEWRAGRRDIPPPMTSQALTISARHTSSTLPARLQRRHSLRDNEWRAIARACVTEVRRPFLSHHSTCQSIALVAGAIPRGTLPPRAAHTMVRSRGTAGTRTNDASPKGVSAHHLPCKAEWSSMASVLKSVARRLSATVRWSEPANVWTCACTLVDNYSMSWQIKV